MYKCRIGAYTTPKINWLKWDEDREDSLAVYALPNTPAIYSDIDMLSKDLFKVQEYGYDWYLLSTNSNIV